MIDPRLVLGMFLLIGGIYTMIWTWIMMGSRRRVEYSELSGNLAKLRRRLFYVFLSIAILVFLVSIVFLPYAPVKTLTVGKPQITVQVQASQFVWVINQTQLPVGVPIEFDVTSTDVNHDFGVYSPDGFIFAQVQAMPGYTNRLIVVFDKPGIYPVHCLEFCGEEHHYMESSLQIGGK